MSNLSIPFQLSPNYWGDTHQVNSTSPAIATPDSMFDRPSVQRGHGLMTDDSINANISYQIDVPPVGLYEYPYNLDLTDFFLSHPDSAFAINLGDSWTISQLPDSSLYAGQTTDGGGYFVLKDRTDSGRQMYVKFPPDAYSRVRVVDNSGPVEEHGYFTFTKSADGSGVVPVKYDQQGTLLMSQKVAQSLPYPLTTDMSAVSYSSLPNTMSTEMSKAAIQSALDALIPLDADKNEQLPEPVRSLLDAINNFIETGARPDASQIAAFPELESLAIGGDPRRRRADGRASRIAVVATWVTKSAPAMAVMLATNLLAVGVPQLVRQIILNALGMLDTSEGETARNVFGLVGAFAPVFMQLAGLAAEMRSGDSTRVSIASRSALALTNAIMVFTTIKVLQSSNEHERNTELAKFADQITAFAAYAALRDAMYFAIQRNFLPPDVGISFGPVLASGIIYMGNQVGVEQLKNLLNGAIDNPNTPAWMNNTAGRVIANVVGETVDDITLNAARVIAQAIGSKQSPQALLIDLTTARRSALWSRFMQVLPSRLSLGFSTIALASSLSKTNLTDTEQSVITSIFLGIGYLPFIGVATASPSKASPSPVIWTTSSSALAVPIGTGNLPPHPDHDELRRRRRDAVAVPWNQVPTAISGGAIALSDTQSNDISSVQATLNGDTYSVVLARKQQDDGTTMSSIRLNVPQSSFERDGFTIFTNDAQYLEINKDNLIWESRPSGVPSSWTPAQVAKSFSYLPTDDVAALNAGHLSMVPPLLVMAALRKMTAAQIDDVFARSDSSASRELLVSILDASGLSSSDVAALEKTLIKYDLLQRIPPGKLDKLTNFTIINHPLTSDQVASLTPAQISSLCRSATWFTEEGLSVAQWSAIFTRSRNALGQLTADGGELFAAAPIKADRLFGLTDQQMRPIGGEHPFLTVEALSAISAPQRQAFYACLLTPNDAFRLFGLPSSSDVGGDVNGNHPRITANVLRSLSIDQRAAIYENVLTDADIQRIFGLSEVGFLKRVVAPDTDGHPNITNDILAKLDPTTLDIVVDLVLTDADTQRLFGLPKAALISDNVGNHPNLTTNQLTRLDPDQGQLKTLLCLLTDKDAKAIFGISIASLLPDNNGDHPDITFDKLGALTAEQQNLVSKLFSDSDLKRIFSMWRM